MKAVVFDLGGTLMQYVGMPYSWVEYYRQGLELRAEIYPDTIEVLQKLREKGYVIAALTDLPSAMPDEVFRRDISELSGFFDYYVSSYVAGYRKPCCKGLQMISEKFSTPMEKLVFVGDEEKDRKTAENANCKFIWLQRGKRKDGSIGDLYELLEILG